MAILKQSGDISFSPSSSSQDVSADDFFSNELTSGYPWINKWMLRSGAYEYIRLLFFPVGFPASVSSNYFCYVKYSFMQVALNTSSRVLATQAMLMAVGVGQSLPMAAAISWALKDGFGQIGSIVVSAIINKDFDSDPKRYRYQAVTLGQAANFFSILSLAYPPLFLLFSATGGALSRVGTVAHISSRARIYGEFSKSLGDLMRCSQAQSTLAALIGTGIGVALSPLGLGSVNTVLAAFVPLAIATQYLAYKSSQIVVLHTLNVQRAEILFKHLVDSLEKHDSFNGVLDSKQLQILTPEEVAHVEVFTSTYRSHFKRPLLVNPQIRPEVADHTDFLKTWNFFIHDDQQSVLLWFSEDATPHQVLMGFFLSCIHREFAHSSELGNSSFITIENVWKVVLDDMSKKGWNIETVFIDSHGSRLKFE